MWGEIYFHQYCIDDTQLQARVSIRKKNYTGSATFIDAGPVPFVKSLLNNEDDLVGGIYPTMASIQLIGTENFGMNELMTANDSDFQIVHIINGEIDWIGFLTPESFGELDTNNKRYLDINAFDGLTRLKTVKFLDDSGANYGVVDGDFEKSFLFVVKECLKKTGLELDFLSLIDRLPVVAGEMTDFTSGNFLGDGWVYSVEFNSLSHDLVKIGNYISYVTENGAGVFTSEILNVDRSDIPNGGGTGIFLSPKPINPAPNISFSAVFFKPEADQTKDALAITTHDTRLWINPDANIDREGKANQTKAYYYFSDGTFNAWDVLNNIALAFDFRVTQENGFWILESMDSHRVNSKFFRYTKDGVFKNMQDKLTTHEIPCKPEKTKYKLDGNTRYIDKTLKSVSVEYQYRTRVEGDNFYNLIKNEDFKYPVGNFNWNTFTPEFWYRKNNGLPLYIERKNQTSVPTTFLEMKGSEGNSKFLHNNGLGYGKINVEKQDEVNISLNHRFTNHYTPNNIVYRYAQQYVSFLITLVSNENPEDVYFLVNKSCDFNTSRFENGVFIMSPKQNGQWVKKNKNSEKVLMYKSNTHSDNPSNIQNGSWSSWNSINIKTDSIPVDGSVSIEIIGSATQVSWYNISNSNNSLNIVPTKYGFYSFDNDKYKQSGEVSFTEEFPSKSSNNFTSFENQFIDQGTVNFWPKIGVSNFIITRIPGQTKGDGRFYEYIQNGDYFDTINNIVIPIGDEDNIDHISTVKVNGVVQDKWITRDNSLQVNPIGLILSKSIMRRYYRPKKMIDGGIGIYPANLSITFSSDGEDIYYRGKSISIDSKNHVITGTFFQVQNEVLPIGGKDYGPNSVKKISGGSSSSGSSVGSGGGGGESPIESIWPLDKVVRTGNETDLDMKSKGTHNRELLGIPVKPPVAGDMLPDLVYVHYNENAPAGEVPIGPDFYIKTANDAALGDILNGQLISYNAAIGKFVPVNQPDLSAYATQAWVNAQDFASKGWVGSQGFATQNWVLEQGYLPKATADGLYKPLSYVPSWGEITGKPLISVEPTSNSLVQRDASGYGYFPYINLSETKNTVDNSNNLHSLLGFHTNNGDAFAYAWSAKAVNNFLGMPDNGDTLVSILLRGNNAPSLDAYLRNIYVPIGGGILNNAATRGLVIDDSASTIYGPLNATNKISAPIMQPDTFIVPSASPTGLQAGQYAIRIVN